MTRAAHNFKWTEASIRAEAAKHLTRGAFESDGGGAVNACRSRYPGLLDELFPRLNNKRYTLEQAMAIGRKFARRCDFMRGASAPYARCLEAGVLDQLGFDPLARSKAYTKWTEEAVRAEAKKYKTKREFERNARGASERARLLGIIDDLGLEEYQPTDNDAIYIWRVVGQFHNGNPVYKIGVTSARLGTQRIEQVAKGAGFEFDLICCEPVQCKASDLERKLHILGEDPQFTGFNGCTEFRALSDSALYTAVSLICTVTT